MNTRALITGLLLTALLLTARSPAYAEYIELPVLAAIGQNNLGVFEIMLVGWDKKSNPTPIELQVYLGGVRYGNTHLGSMAQAFAYAVERTPGVSHTGTMSVQGVTYRPTASDGPSAAHDRDDDDQCQSPRPDAGGVQDPMGEPGHEAHDQCEAGCQ